VIGDTEHMLLDMLNDAGAGRRQLGASTSPVSIALSPSDGQPEATLGAVAQAELLLAGGNEDGPAEAAAAAAAASAVADSDGAAMGGDTATAAEVLLREARSAATQHKMELRRALKEDMARRKASSSLEERTGCGPGARRRSRGRARWRT
jgi:hypothetical protein